MDTSVSAVPQFCLYEAQEIFCLTHSFSLTLWLYSPLQSCPNSSPQLHVSQTSCTSNICYLVMLPSSTSSYLTTFFTSCSELISFVKPHLLRSRDLNSHSDSQFLITLNDPFHTTFWEVLLFLSSHLLKMDHKLQKTLFIPHSFQELFITQHSELNGVGAKQAETQE